MSEVAETPAAAASTRSASEAAADDAAAEAGPSQQAFDSWISGRTPARRKALDERLQKAATDIRAQPGMPMPSGLESVLTSAAPADASCCERLRDRVLWCFAHPCAQRIFLTLSLLTCVLVVVTGLVIVFTIFGLFLNVENGWQEYRAECITLAMHWNQTLTSAPARLESTAQIYTCTWMSVAAAAQLPLLLRLRPAGC